MALDLHNKNNAICRSILKTILKVRDQISLWWQLTSVHSKFVGHSTEIIRQSKIRGPLKKWKIKKTFFHSLFYSFLQKIKKTSRKIFMPWSMMTLQFLEASLRSTILSTTSSFVRKRKREGNKKMSFTSSSFLVLVVLLSGSHAKASQDAAQVTVNFGKFIWFLTTYSLW